MAARSSRVAITTPTERLIIDTLARINLALALSYEQCVVDLRDITRRSYRGVAHELREILRETLNMLAPDGEVMAEAGFKLEMETKGPTHRQKALHVLKKRRLSREQISAPELTISMIDEIGAQITRTAYTRGSKDAHSASSSGPEVRQLKMYVDAVLGELLEIHAQKPA